MRVKRYEGKGGKGRKCQHSLYLLNGKICNKIFSRSLSTSAHKQTDGNVISTHHLYNVVYAFSVICHAKKGRKKA